MENNITDKYKNLDYKSKLALSYNSYVSTITSCFIKHPHTINDICSLYDMSETELFNILSSFDEKNFVILDNICKTIESFSFKENIEINMKK